MLGNFLPMNDSKSQSLTFQIPLNEYLLHEIHVTKYCLHVCIQYNYKHQVITYGLWVMEKSPDCTTFCSLRALSRSMARVLEAAMKKMLEKIKEAVFVHFDQTWYGGTAFWPQPQRVRE